MSNEDQNVPFNNILNNNISKNESSFNEENQVNPLLGKWKIEPSECHPEVYLGLHLSTDGLIKTMELKYTDNT
jgi:hypothetical protein